MDVCIYLLPVWEWVGVGFKPKHKTKREHIFFLAARIRGPVASPLWANDLRNRVHPKKLKFSLSRGEERKGNRKLTGTENGRMQSRCPDSESNGATKQ